MKRLLVALLIATGLLLALLAIGLGPSKINAVETLAILFGRPSSPGKAYIITQLRLPRILTAYMVGAILGLSGAVFQAALRNPMADPFILGVSSGASFGVALALSFGFSAFLGFPSAALVGATATMLIIFTLSVKQKGTTTTLLLTGVAMNYILSSAMTLLLFLNKEQYQRILHWSLGSFSTATWSEVTVIALIVTALIIVLLVGHRSLDMLLLDESTALASGLNVGKTRLTVLLLASIGTAICVSYFGIIGFIGLMAPHISRLVFGPKHRSMLAPTALFGGTLLLASDTLARIILPSGELPVGIITSLMGVPLFLSLLRKRRYHYG